MNPMTSKIVKSSRTQVVNRSIETIQVYSCQLYIDSFKISHRGFVFFLWLNQNNQIQSLKYESTGKTTQVKQTLTIGVRVISKNGKQQPLNTYLKLMSEEGQELDQFQLSINTLTSQFKQMEVPMDRGLCILKARRKPMNISEQQQVNFKGLYRSRNMKFDEKKQSMAGESDALQQQLLKTKKQLQDEVYLNNKLKNDRDVLIANKQQLQLEIQKLLIQITKEITVLRGHYDNRITIREHCYEEEIENLVNVFNSENEQNKKVIELILKQKHKIEEEIKPLIEKNKKLNIQINQKNQTISQLQQQKFEYEKLLKQKSSSLEELNFIGQSLGKQKQLQDNEITELKLEISSLHARLEDNKLVFLNYDQKIKDLQKIINDYDAMVKSNQQKIKDLQNQLHVGKQREDSGYKQKEMILREKGYIEQQKQRLLEQLKILKAKMEQYEYEMEFNQNVMGQLKKQHQQKEDELYFQIQNLEQIYAKKMEQLIAQFKNEKDSNSNSSQLLQKEKEEMEGRLKELSNIAEQSQIKMNNLNNQISSLQSQMKINKDTIEGKDKMIQGLQKEKQKLKNQLQKHLLAGSGDQQKKVIQKNTIEELNKKILELETTIGSLQLQLNKSKLQIENKDKKIKEVQQKLQATSTNEQSLRKTKSIRDLKGEDSHRANQDQIYLLLSEKEAQLNDLKRKLDELQHLYEHLQLKMNLILSKYPNIDMDLINDQLGQECRCDSEQEEQKIINQNLKMLGSLKEVPEDINEQSKVFNQSICKIKMSIGNQNSQTEEAIRKEINRSYNKFYSERLRESKPETQLFSSIKGGSPIKRQIPNSPTRLKKQISINTYKDNRYELSGTSYVKVSHSKKIKDQEQKIQYLQKKEENYLKQIQNYNQQLAKLKNQLNELSKSKKQRPEENSMLISSPSFRLPVVQVKKVSTESQIFLEDQKFKSLILENQNKQIESQKKNLRIGQLEEEMKQLNRLKNESEQQSRLQQEKVNELLRREDQNNRKVDSLNELIKHLQKQMGQLQQKLRKQKQISQETRISVKEINIHYQNAQSELKKLKNLNQTLQEKVKKLSGSELIVRDLNKEIEDLGKRALEMTRTINHMKLEKDSNQEELRMLKKRQSDQARIASQWQEKAASLERQIEQQKRKQNKLKRQIQEGHEDIRRIKLQQKKQEQELQAMTAAQISWQLERRKHLDEITNLQDQLSRKDYEFTKLNKEIQKWKSRAEQKDDLRLGKKSELKEEMQKLQNELIRKQKKLFEQIQQSKLLRSRLQLLQKQNKRIIEQKNQNYGQKLKYYVEEMGNIKKLLDEYQVENSRLKVENNQLYQQYQMMRVSLDKLQNKYDEGNDREDDILNELQSYINEVNMLKERLNTANQESDRLQFAFNTLKKQNDQEKAQNKKNLEKLQNSERNLQRTLVQIKDYKIKISEYETNSQINNKIAERYRFLERKKMEQDEELKKLKSDYQNAINTYIFKREDLEKAVNQTREHQRKLKLEEIQRIQQDCNKTIASKTQRLQSEILEVYNENSRLRAQMQVLLEQNGKDKGRLTQLQITCSRVGSLEVENEQNRTKLQELRQQLKKKNERITKLQISIEGLNGENNVKDRQLNAIKTRMKQLESNIDKLNQEIKSRRSAERQLQDALIRATEKKQREKGEQDFLNYQRQTQMIQQYESKISSLEIQLQRAKEKEARTIEENASKMKKLQKKMDQMEQALKEKEKAIENHYEGQLKELQNSLMRLSQELEEKMIRNQELNEGILILEDENKALIKEIQTLRYQSEDDKNIFQSQLLKLKAKLKESETAYSSNLKSLEEELMRATQNKSINNASNSRVKTNEAQQRISKRYEEKLKNKDRKIQELKQNIYTLQETILKLKKRETLFQSNLAQIEKLKVIISDFEKQKKNMQLQFGQESNLNTQLVRQLRKEILQLKQKQEKARFLADQKILEFESVNCELKTIRQLYQDLQRDLQKRKNNLAIQLEEESTLQNQVRVQQNKIIDLQEKVLQSQKATKEYQLQLRKKNNQLKRQADTNQQLTVSQQKLKLEINNLKTQIVQLKKHIAQVETSYYSIKNQLKLSKVEISKLRKSQEDLKQLCSAKENIASDLKRQYDQILKRYREFEESAHKYQIINERSRQQIGCGIEQIIDKYTFMIDQREMQYNQLLEEIQELKFLNERKFMDYDEIKKLNFELQLKVEQYETLNDQLQTLRKICDRLQEQKKNSVFREEVLRMQIQNLANTGPSQLRTRIEGILATQVAPSFVNFSFY